MQLIFHGNAISANDRQSESIPNAIPPEKTPEKKAGLIFGRCLPCSATGVLASVILILLSTVSSLVATEWPRFRGPNGTGVSDAVNLPIEFGPTTNLFWKTELPAGISSPIVTGNRIFVTAYEQDQRLTVCLDMVSGKRLWERSITAVRQERKSKPNSPAASTPTTDGTNIYVLFSDFGMLAYSMDGEERWRVPLGPFNPPHGMATSPILAHGALIVVADQVTDSHIAAHDSTTGRQLWRTPRGNFVGGYSTPVVLGQDVVVSGPVEMIAYSSATGQRNWSVPRMGVMPISSPVVRDDVVFAYNDAVPPFESLARDLKGDRNGDGKLEPNEFPDPSFKEAVLAIDRAYGNNDGAIDQKEWDSALKLMNTMNAFVAVRLTGAQPVEIWRNTKFLADAASPLLYRDVLYLIKNGGILSSVDSHTGEVIRQERIPEFGGQVFASPVAADSKIFILNSAGKLAVVSAGREWQTLRVNDLGEGGYATPALVGNLILVRTDRTLWAFQRLSGS